MLYDQVKSMNIKKKKSNKRDECNKEGTSKYEIEFKKLVRGVTV